MRLIRSRSSLTMSGRHPHHLLQPRVAGAGVVDRDQGAAVRAAPRRAPARVSSSGTNSCSVISITSPLRSAGKRLGHRLRGEGRGADVQRQVGPIGRPTGSSAARIAAASSSGPEAAAVSLREPRLRRAPRRAREARQRLVSDQVPAGQVDDRLEDRLDRLRLRDQGGDLGRLPVGPGRAPRARGRSGACAACPAASPSTGRRRRAGRGSRRPPRRPGRWRCPPSRRASMSAHRDSRDRFSGPLGDPVRDLAVGAREDQRELLAPDPGGGVGGCGRRPAASCPPPSAPRPRTGARECRSPP